LNFYDLGIIVVVVIVVVVFCAKNFNVAHFSNILEVINMKSRVLAFLVKVAVFGPGRGHNSESNTFGVMLLHNLDFFSKLLFSKVAILTSVNTACIALATLCLIGSWI
jgi:VanZ family protein